MISRTRLLALTIAASYFLLTACGASPDRIPTNSTETAPSYEIVNGKLGGALTYRITTPIKTLNYFQADDEPSVLLTLFLVNDRLVALDHREQKYVPSLAESYTVLPDGMTVDVLLRDGLKFSDGSSLTSADVEFSLAAVYDKRTNSPIFRDSLLIGGKEIRANVIDDRRFQLILPEKVASVENYLENLAILPKRALESDHRTGKLSETWKITTDAASVVGSGPFAIEAIQPGERVKLKRNPYYWKKDDAGTPLPYLDALVLEIVPDANNSIARLQEGTLDIADRVRASDFAALKSGGGAVRGVDAGPGLATDHIWFNLNPATKSGERLDSVAKYSWFSDKRFRKAIAHAVDRTSISTNTLQGLATPTYGFVAAGNRAWIDQAAPKTEFDLARAASLLTEAGFQKKEADGKVQLIDKNGEPVAFTLIVPVENEPRKLMAAVIQEDLSKLGMAVQIAPIDFQGLSERWTTTFDYDAILLGVGLTAIDPSSYASFLPSSGSAHQWRPNQTEPATAWERRVDELFSQQARELDVAMRKIIFNEIQAVYSEEMPVVPIVTRHIVSAVNERVGNLSPSGILPYSLWNADRLFIKN